VPGAKAGVLMVFRERMQQPFYYIISINYICLQSFDVDRPLFTFEVPRGGGGVCFCFFAFDPHL
jgi:hypothetical protein